MDSPTYRSGADDDDAAVSVELPMWEADAGGAGLRVEGRAVVRCRHVSDAAPPELICYFITVPNYYSENSRFAVRQPFHRLTHQHTWEEETRRMFSSVAAYHVRRADLELLAAAFSMYTLSMLNRFPIMDLAEMEFSSVIEVPVAPAASPNSQLRIFLPMEEYRYLFSWGDDVDVESRRGACRPASAAAVAGLQMVTPEEPGSCPICLDDFNAIAQVLAMPCRHLFHEACLKEWLMRSDFCPLCRFSLPVVAE